MKAPLVPDLSRTRLVVVQVLVICLMATLFARLWYLQVVSGDAYQAQAAENAVRDVSVLPQRGLIVDAMGRPLAASRQSWVLSVDRTALGRLSTARRVSLLRRVSHLTQVPLGEIRNRLLLCGEPGAPPPPRCWNGSPYQPVPIAEDVPERVAVEVQERSEDFPALVAEQQTVRDYPSPFGVNAAHLLGYLSPVTGDEYERARAHDDASLTASSLVGRSGVEREYDRWLRGTPGTDELGVDSLGRVLGPQSSTAPVPGDTLVTSIDARVQAAAERELARTIRTARQTMDPVSGRTYRATSGATVVLDPSNGRVIAMASYPTYDPSVWVGGITSSQLHRLYSQAAGEPLLSRPTQGQLAPGSTFKPFSTAGVLGHGYTTSSQLECSSSYTVGGRTFQNYESAAHGYLTFAQALQLSCDTFFYRIGYAKWLQEGADAADVDARDVLVANAEDFGFGRPTGIDLPGEASGRIADRHWKLQYWKDNKDYYCRVARQSGSDYLHVFAREFCVDGYTYRAGDAVNFIIGQGDTTVTPIQLATAYSALVNGGMLWQPRVAKAILSPDGDVVRRIAPESNGRVSVPQRYLDYIDTALKGTPTVGTLAWKFGGFPLDRVRIRGKTGTAEVYGKQTTSWLATYDKDYVVVQMIEQGGTGSGTSGDGVRGIWEALYGIDGQTVHHDRALIPGTRPPSALPTVDSAGVIEPPGGDPSTPARGRRAGSDRGGGGRGRRGPGGRRW